MRAVHDAAEMQNCRMERVGMEKTNLQHCTGCRVCEQICPRHCISMEPDPEGFLYPHIDTTSCVECGLCVKHCPIHHTTGKEGAQEPAVYAVWLKDRYKRLQSSSGGAFTAIAVPVLEAGGAVFGCAFDENLVPRHICIRKREDLARLMGSKYVQSDTGHTFSQVRQLLDDNVTVLYSGTPCQIAGLKSFLHRDYSNLLTVDLVCHGVPGPTLFQEYLGWLGRKHHKKVTSISFRDKSEKGWGEFGRLDFCVEDRVCSKSIIPELDPYFSLFLHGETSRTCCYGCAYASPMREGDFTIGDFWGITRFYPELAAHDGVSLLIVNSEKASFVLRGLSKSLFMRKATLEQATAENGQLLHPTAETKNRSAFADAARSGNFVTVVALWKKLYRKQILWARAKKRIPPGLKKILKMLRG